ncbi:MAG: hypothetical protein ACOVQ5_09725 [Flavobacteriales bacterium]|jgi:hypothetical protein
MRKNAYLFLLALALLGCKKEENPGVPLGPTPDTSPKLIFKFRFDENQVRLNNLGTPSEVPSGHAAQSPNFHKISAHYVEMTNGSLVPLGGGEILYSAPETAQGGALAIDFSQAIVVGENEVFLEIPLSQVDPDTYEWMRVSLAYQNYDIDFRYQTFNLTGRLASFVGYNTYIGSYLVNTQTIAVNDDKLQGYWGMEVVTPFVTQTFQGQSPQGATTVPNPLASTSPIPAGSCVVTGNFAEPLVITGSETEDIVVTLSLSSNQSFEWIDTNSNGIFEPEFEQVVDMGLRGLIPIVE